MAGTSGAARQHIEVMEARIQQQTALIVELRQAGQDTLEAARRLALLHHAMEEMRVLLGEIPPPETRTALKRQG